MASPPTSASASGDPVRPPEPVPPHAYAEAVARGLWRAGADLIGYIPSVSVAPVITALLQTLPDDGATQTLPDDGMPQMPSRVFPLSREKKRWVCSERCR